MRSSRTSSPAAMRTPPPVIEASTARTSQVACSVSSPPAVSATTVPSSPRWIEQAEMVSGRVSAVTVVPPSRRTSCGEVIATRSSAWSVAVSRTTPLRPAPPASTSGCDAVASTSARCPKSGRCASRGRRPRRSGRWRARRPSRRRGGCRCRRRSLPRRRRSARRSCRPRRARRCRCRRSRCRRPARSSVLPFRMRTSRESLIAIEPAATTGVCARTTPLTVPAPATPVSSTIAPPALMKTPAVEVSDGARAR